MSCGSWYREIELQKVFGLSPCEARYFAWFDGGLSSARIAEICGVSVNTVGATLQKARVKMKKVQGRTVQFMIVKGNKDNEGTAIRQHSVAPVARFVAKCLGAEYFEGRHIISVSGIDASAAGDLKWCMDNVLRFVYWEGVSNNEEEDEAVAEKLMDAYELRHEEGTPCPVGIALLRFVLDSKFMEYDVIEV